MALEPQVVQAAMAVLVVTGMLGGYVLSVEKRLNGRAALRETLEGVQKKVDQVDEKLDLLTLHIARIDAYVDLVGRREAKNLALMESDRNL